MLDDINNLFNDVNIPKNKIIVLHVRLKLLLKNKFNYTKLSKDIISSVTDLFQPKDILVPSFTYSFTNSNFFDVKQSSSEVGRFSEEIRKLSETKKRSCDPIFSLVSINNKLNNLDIDFKSAFGKKSIWDVLSKSGYIILNINLPEPIVTTHIHYLEQKYKVDYRFIKSFKGVVKNHTGIDVKINYEYFVRDLRKNKKWNRYKIYKYLKDNNAIIESKNGLVKAFSSKSLDILIGNALMQDKNFLIKK
tara:strand:+ start:147 stop:890 length:744 start_codon:yes stop_codon:yes gene_type:complete